MRQSPFPYLREQNEQVPSGKPSAFERLTGLVIPALTLLATIVALSAEQPQFVAWLLVLFVLSFGVYFYRPTTDWLSRQVKLTADKWTAERMFPAFRRFVRQFGEFVDTGRSDNVQQITLHEVFRSNVSEFERLGVPPVQLFWGFWDYLRKRAETTEPSLGNLLESIAEFNHLVGSYIQNCLVPIYERMPNELRSQLTPQAKSSLESFRERFVQFLVAYEQFLKEFDDSVKSEKVQPHYLYPPKPL